MKVVSRLKRSLDTLRWLRPLAGSYPAAAWIVIKRKLGDNALLSAQFSRRPFYFRGTDSNALFEVFHEREYGFLDSIICETEAPVIIDVGAHIGTFAIRVLCKNPSARVLGVEADPDTFGVLSKNKSLGQEDWEIINRAASDKDGATIRFSTDGPTMSHRISPNGTLQVETISLGHLVDQAAGDRIVDILKVDIEGAEELFLCAAPHLLTRVRCLVVELHPGLCDITKVREVIDAHFKVVQDITGRHSNKPLLYCCK